MLAVLTFTMYFIIPKFKAIFDGFNIELPEITLALIRSADFAVEYFYLVIPAIMALLLAMGTAGFELTGLLSGSSTTPRFLFRWLPRLRMPTLLRCLSLSVDGARSLHDTLILLLTRHPNPAMRVRLAAVEESVAQGQACWESFHAAGLLRRRDVNLLESAERVGNLSWALRGVADSMERRTEQRARLIAECVRPLGMLVVGTIVGFFVIGMFIPVVKVILELPIEGVST
jgi:type IV pilus assembly protein PilC